MTREQEYQRIRADAERFRAGLSAEFLQALRAWHDLHPYECAAHNEGQLCCVDYILGDIPERWSP